MFHAQQPPSGGGGLFLLSLLKGRAGPKTKRVAYLIEGSLCSPPMLRIPTFVSRVQCYWGVVGVHWWCIDPPIRPHYPPPGVLALVHLCSLPWHAMVAAIVCNTHRLVLAYLVMNML